MRRATLKSLGRDYYISDEPGPHADGLPIFSQREVEILKRSRDTMTVALLTRIYDTKASIGGTLEEISLKIAAEEDMNQSPQEEIGYTPPQKPGSPGELAQRFAPNIIARLKGAGAKTREEKEEEQPPLF